MICNNCRQIIPIDSNYCPFCSQQITQLTYDLNDRPTESLYDIEQNHKNNRNVTTGKLIKGKHTIFFLAAICIVLLIGNLYIFFAYSSMKEEIVALNNIIHDKEVYISSLKTKISSHEKTIDLKDSEIGFLEEENYELIEKAEFMDDHIVFVSDDGNSLYHKFDCSRMDFSRFWAYNTEAAISKGYRPCGRCN